MKIQKADPPTLQDKKHWSKLFHDFLTKCLQKSPESRLPADQLLQVDISYVLLWYLYCGNLTHHSKIP